MADLLAKASGRQDADPDVGAVPREIVGLTALGKIGGGAPVIRIDPLRLAGPAQRPPPAGMGAGERLRIAADAVDGGARPLQMLRWAIDAFLTGDIQDVAVCGALPRRRGAGRNDHASTDFLGAGGIHLDVMHVPVYPIDHEPDPLAHLVAAQPLIEHAADDALCRVLAAQDVARRVAVLRQPLALQCPVHGFDDVAALAKLPQRRLGHGGYDPFAGCDLGGQPHALQLARALDQEGSILTEGVAHVLVGAQVGELLPLLLGNQHPVELGKAIGIDLPLKLLRHLKLGLATQFPGDDLAGPRTDAVGDIVAGNVEDPAVVGNTPDEDVGVGVAGVVMVNRDPVEPCLDIDFHLPHQTAGGLARIGQRRSILCRDDEAELMAIIAAAIEESAAILHIALGRIDLPLPAIPGHAVPFEVAQVRVHRLGADKLASASGSALWIELHHAGLHRHPTRPGAHSASVPAPRAPILEAQRRCSAPAPRVEPAASLPGARDPVRITAGAPDGAMDFTEEAGRASARRADAARGFLPAPAIADLAGADAKVVFVARHETTIGIRRADRKS